MDKLVYTAAAGARQIMLAQAVNSHNLANASTVAFKADLVHAQTEYVRGGALESRAWATAAHQGVDTGPGAVRATGRELDIAINGEGWIAVQAADGTEAYTRRGDLRVDEFGQLINGAGRQILGNNGPIALPPFAGLEIGGDGTLSIIPLGEAPNTLAVLDRIKLVSPAPENLVKRSDGLLALAGGETAEADAVVRLVSGSLESSNVNTVESMVRMIELSRQFETHVRMMKAAEEMDTDSASLMRLQ